MRELGRALDRMTDGVNGAGGSMPSMIPFSPLAKYRKVYIEQISSSSILLISVA